ncbi:hypothetical protein SDC9_140859 [bioreactor metagenome]|uniref:Uncharacterized protein n=1 Tax=bioreactor metagenome TaxID=1076179 RepID=A0A645DWG5_9ZZZZ
MGNPDGHGHVALRIRRKRRHRVADGAGKVGKLIEIKNAVNQQRQQQKHHGVGVVAP